VGDVPLRHPPKENVIPAMLYPVTGPPLPTIAKAMALLRTAPIDRDEVKQPAVGQLPGPNKNRECVATQDPRGQKSGALLLRKRPGEIRIRALGAHALQLLGRLCTFPWGAGAT